VENTAWSSGGFDGGGRDRVYGTVHPPGVFPGEAADRQGISSFRSHSGGTVNENTMQPVVKIAPKLALVNHLGSPS
jgi:hypothetical protein